MGRFRQFLTLKIQLTRHGFRFHHKPMKRIDWFTNLGFMGSALIGLIDPIGWGYAALFLIAALVS